ncbi:MAG TPA: zf-HC2 domain-containing protein [bacterium]|nr:zf-HC2 domain-containing protein [bacterium]
MKEKETSCRFRDLLSDALDGELSAVQQAQLEEHLLVCEDCRSALSAYQKVTSLLREMPEASMPTDMVQAVLKETTNTQAVPVTMQENDGVAALAPGRQGSSMRWVRWSAAVAAVLVVAFLWNGLISINNVLSRPMLTSIVASADEELSGIDLVFSFNPRRISVKTIESALESTGFLIVSHVGKDEVRISMASPERFHPDGGASIVTMQILPKSLSRDTSSFLRLEAVRAYRPDGRPASVTLDQVSVPLPEQCNGDGGTTA